MEEEQRVKYLESSWVGFNSNVGALYSFYEASTQFADAQDKEKITKIANEFANILKEDPEQAEKELLEFVPSIDNLDVYPDFRENKDFQEAVSLFQDEQIKNQLLTWENRHPHKSQKLGRMLNSLYSNPPMSGILIRKGILVTLITFLEVLVEGLFTQHFLFNDMNKDDAINEANRLTSKKGWNRRLDNLGKTGIPNEVYSMYRSEILEFTELRNLLVHNDGVVDTIFMERASQHYKGKIKPGSILVVSSKRLRRALDVIFSYGVMLNQSRWRQNQENAKQPDTKLDQLILSCFDEKRYSLILELAEASKCLHLSEGVRQRMLVDRAIAFRETGNIDEINSILSTLTNTDHDWQIEIAISMLKKDYTKLRSQLLEAQNKYNIIKIAHWPLFDPIRNEVWFKMLFLKRGKVRFPTSKRKH